jgi:hypothetical protein
MVEVVCMRELLLRVEEGERRGGGGGGEQQEAAAAMAIYLYLLKYHYPFRSSFCQQVTTESTRLAGER